MEGSSTITYGTVPVRSYRLSSIVASAQDIFGPHFEPHVLQVLRLLVALYIGRRHVSWQG